MIYAPFWALRKGQSIRADGCALGQPNATLDARERGTGRLRRSQTQERFEGPWGRGHFGAPLLALLVTPADNQDRAQVSELAEAPCRRQPASRWRWRSMWIRAIQESSQQERLPSTVSTSR